MKKFSNYYKNRVLYIVLPVLISLAMLLPLRKAQINTDLMEYLPETFPERANLLKLEEEFGKYEPVVLFVESSDVLETACLERVKAISESLAIQSEIEEVLSVFNARNIHSEDGSMIVDPAVKRIPQSALERELLRDEIKKNELVYTMFVSENFRYTLIILNPTAGISDNALFDIVDSVLMANPGSEKISISGLPYLRDQIQSLAIRDLALLMPFGLLLMVLYLFFSFHGLRGVLLPFSVVVMSIVVAMGLMPLLNWELSIIAVLVPIMMIAIANNYGVHLVTRSLELRAQNPEWDMKQIARESLDKLKWPIILTGLTTIVGVLGMAVHIMLPAQQMGVVSAVGVGFALIVSLSFIPAVMQGLKTGKINQSFNGGKTRVVDKVLHFFGILATQKAKSVLIGFTLIFVLAGLGINRLQVTINMENMMAKDHPLRQASIIGNTEFGGNKTISALFEGDIKSPEIMQAMDKIESRLEQQPGIGSVTSIATVIRLISKTMNEPGDKLYGTIPSDRDAIAQYIEFYSMNGEPDDFEKLVNFEYTKAVLTIQFQTDHIKNFNKLEKDIREILARAPYCTLLAGQSLVEKKMSVSIVRGQMYSLIFALAAILILLGLIFKSIVAGLIGSIPLIASLLCNFGLMGWLGIELNIATSLLSSVAIGIGVDYTIHLFWRLKFERSKGKSYQNAITHTLKTTGRGIGINAVSVKIGFSVLFFSGLVILQTFALLIILSLLICLLCALVYVPALCLVFRPEFLDKHDKSNIPY
jgi:uncharacterized protein